MSAFNVTVQWILLDGRGETIAIWADRPIKHQIELALNPRLDACDVAPPFMLIEAFRREVWDVEEDWGAVHRVNVEAPPPAPAREVQSGPRKVIIR